MAAVQPTPGAGANTFNTNIVDPQTGYAVNMAPGSNASQGALLVSSDGAKATYSTGAAAVAQVATPTAYVLMQGSATKTIRIKRVRIAGVATAAGNQQIQFARWSTAGTAGSATLVGMTAVKHDITDPAATATVSYVQTANYGTQGTGSTLPFLCDRIFFATVAAALGDANEFNFATRNDKALILRGTTDIIAISGNASAIPTGGVVDISIEWEEDNS